MDRKYLIGVLLTSGIILCGNLVSMWEVHSIWRDVGAGDFSVTDWQESETLKWIKQNPTRQPLYSNAADFASFFGRSTVNRFPKSGGVSEELFSGGDVLYGAFFARSFRRYLASPEELVSVCREYQRVEFEDGLLIVCHRS